jgi:hypothetical protein
MKRLDYHYKFWLKEKYFDEEMSLGAIAKVCGTSPETIRRWMVRYGFQLRTCSQGRKLRQKRQRQAKNEELLRSVMEEDHSAFEELWQQLEDERMFKDSPHLLAPLGRRRDKEIRVRTDAEARRRERQKQERENRQVDSSPYTVEDEMELILARFKKPSKD